MAIEPISAIGAAQRAQALAAAQEIPASTVAATLTGDAAQRAAQQQAAAQAAQLQTAQPQETAAQTAAREAAAAARAAEIQAGRDTAQAQAAQARDAVRQAVVDSRAATAARQGGLAPLFADLAQAAGGETQTAETPAPQTPGAQTQPAQAQAPQTPTTPALPAAVRQAIDQVLALQLPTGDTVTAESLRQAVERSGLFLEARLAAQTDANAQTDLKAALLALRQALTAAATAPETSAPAAAETPEVRSQTAPLPSPTATTPTPTPPETLASTATPQATATAPPPTTPEEPTPTTTADAARVASQSSAALNAQNAATPETEGPPPQTQAAATLAQQAATPVAEPEAAPTPATPPTAQQTAAQALQSAQQAAADAAVIETAEQADQQAARQIALTTQTVQTAQAAQAAQAAQPTALDIARMVSQSSLLLAAQEAAMPDEDERHLNPPLPGTPFAKDDIAPVARILALQPVPPVRDSALGGQAPAIAALPRGADNATVLQHLSQEVDQALARQTLHQLESLKAGGATEGAAATWMFEIPIATPQGTAIAQFEIDRDGRRMGDAAAGPAWRARFAIDVEPLGPVHVHLSMNGGQTAATVYAERPGSLERLRAQGEMLARELSGEVVFHTGAPRRPVATSGHFVDQTT